MHVQVLRITLIVGQGPDLLSLALDLPSGCWPYKGHATAMLEVAAGSGEEYAARHFPGVPLTKVSTRER